MADADFGIEPSTSSGAADLFSNRYFEPIKPEEIAPLLSGIDLTSNENTFNSILDINDEYQFKNFSSSVPLDPCDSHDIFKDFRPDLLESYDSVKESDKNHSIDNILKLPDVTDCPVPIISPDSSKDDCTISSEIQSLNTSEICDVDSTNADYSDAELYKCLQEYEEREDILSANCNGSSSADILTPYSEFSDELIAEKPLICDDSVSETKDTTSSEVSNDLLLNNRHEQPQEDTNEELLSEEEKVILEEILKDSSDFIECCEESRTIGGKEKSDEQLEQGLENISEVAVELEVTKDQSQKCLDELDEYNDIPGSPIDSKSNVELEFQHGEPIQTVNQSLEKLIVTNTDNETVLENHELLSEQPIECIHPSEKEPTDSLCSIESTETILLKDDNQVSVNTVTDSLDSQSTCSLPSEVVGDNVESLEETCIQRPSTLDLNGTINCETEIPSTLSTGMFKCYIILAKFLIT